jgi:shikimate dehydrogenase
MSELKIYAVTGKPVLHSRSPAIFNSWFRAAGLNAVYTRLAAGDAGDAIRTARAMKLAGLNVTSPFKEKIMGFLDGADAHASRIGAANCVIREGNRLLGTNTDFVGVVRALKKNGVDPRNQSVAILGAGGAARAAAYGVLRARAAGVTFLNRTEDTAKKASIGLGCDYAPWERAGRVIGQSDILVSCVPSGPNWNSVHRSKGARVVLQADYRSAPDQITISRRGQAFIRGYDWLVYQAVPAFRLFSGRTPSYRQISKAFEGDLAERPSNKANVALVGFMGSGKTAIGRILSTDMGWEFVDTDAEIEKSTGMTVPEIFAKRGEPYFREKEKSLIDALVPPASNKVFSLGGGAILNEDTRALLTRHCRVLWLWAPLRTALARIDAGTRPVLKRADGERAIRRAFQIRSEACARASDLVLNTETASPEVLAERIRYEMDQALGD